METITNGGALVITPKVNWDSQKAHFVLKSGRVLTANLGVLGVDKYGRMTTGYDYHPSYDERGDERDSASAPLLTLQERAEIAEYQKALWERWVHEAAAVEERPAPKASESYVYTVRQAFVPTHAKPHRFETFGGGIIGSNFCGIAGCGKLKDDAIHV